MGTRRGLLLLLYAAGIALLLVHSREIVHGLAGLAELFRPFLLGIVLAFVLSQPYDLLRRLLKKRLRMREASAHVLAIVLTYLLVIAAAAAVIRVVLPQLADGIRLFTGNLERYLRDLQTWLDELSRRLHVQSADLSGLAQLLSREASQLDDAVGLLAGGVASATGTMLRALANFLLAAAFSVYLIAGKNRLLSQSSRLLRAWLPAGTYGGLREVLQVIVRSFRGYVIGQSTEAVILGSLCFAGMLLLRLEYAGVISIVVALTALIPILGAYIGGVIAVILLTMVSPVRAGIFLIFFIILQQVENNVIYPRVVGGRLGLPGIWVLLAITVGGKLGGVVGMLFGVPSMAVVYTLLKNSVRAREKKSAAAQTKQRKHDF